MPNVYVGTSGWQYEHWRGVFYPENLPQKEWLGYYAKYFDTVEVNATFYHQMKRETFEKWRKIVGPDFTFSIKGSRFITHIKRLKDCKEALEKFMESVSGLTLEAGPSFVQPAPRVSSAQGLGHSTWSSPKSGIRGALEKGDAHLLQNLVLWQLPPRYKIDIKRLETFLSELRASAEKFCVSVLQAFEFRDKSWLDPKIYSILKDSNCALVIQDSPYWPTAEVITADFVYLRFHGRESLYASCYSEAELDEWAKKMKQWLKKGLDVYAYFNNDALGYAIDNAKTLKEMLK